jgi:hypothetical protein
VTAGPIILGDGHTGRIPASMPPNRDMLSAICALEAFPKADSN